ncbi:hypothetical protein CR513_04181, partial [Mucuna pruriens]
MASNNNDYFPSDRHVIQRLTEMYQVDTRSTMDRKLDALGKQIESLIQCVSSPSPTYEQCGTTSRSSNTTFLGEDNTKVKLRMLKDKKKDKGSPVSPKLKDPSCFTIPCTIGNSYFDKAPCVIGASINIMPYFILKKLDL